MVLILATGCGGVSAAADAEVADAPDIDGGGSDAGLADAALPDAELPDAELPDAEVPDASTGPISMYGAVSISESTDTVGSDNSGGEAVFKTEPFLGIPSATAGGCGLYQQPTTVGSSAGVVSIAGANVAVSFTPTGVAPMVAYDQTPNPTPDDLFAPGATITASAPGTAAFPAFTISATAPTDLTGFTPGASFSRSTPPTFTWTAGSGDTMIVQLVTIDAAFSDIEVLICFVPDTGSFPIPAAAMALIPAAQTQALMFLGRAGHTVQNPSPSTQVELYVVKGRNGDLGPLGP